MNPTRFRQALGLLLLTEAALSVVPAIVLGTAIGWPASLSFSAHQILPLIQDHLAEVRLGYGVYLLYSLLFFPILVLLARWAQPQTAGGPGFQFAVGLAALSTLARTLGIVRWLAPVPGIAAWYTAPGGTTESREAAAGIFNAIDAYGGTIGEAFGIGLFGGGAVVVFSVILLSKKMIPRWLAWWGLIVGLVQLPTFVTVFGVDLGAATTVAALFLMMWFLTLGIQMFRESAKQSG